MKREPLITTGVITAVVSAVLALLASLGLGIDPAVTNAIMGLVAVLAPLAVAWLARKHVTPVADPKDGNGSPLAPESDAAEEYEPADDGTELVDNAEETA